jgi:hypothetical protein
LPNLPRSLTRRSGFPNAVGSTKGYKVEEKRDASSLP